MKRPRRRSQRGRSPRMMRQDEAHRPDDVRGIAQKDLAFDQRLAHQPEGVMLQIPQPAMDQFRRCTRGTPGEVSGLAQIDRQAPPGCITCNPAAVHPAPDDGEVDFLFSLGQNLFP